jgi:hypothetical protein
MHKCARLVLICSAVLAGCSANPLLPEARAVRIVTSEPAGCEYLGEVTGNQGNFFTGDFTNNAEVGSSGAAFPEKNPLRDNALRLAV